MPEPLGADALQASTTVLLASDYVIHMAIQKEHFTYINFTYINKYVPQ